MSTSLYTAATLLTALLTAPLSPPNPVVVHQAMPAAMAPAIAPSLARMELPWQPDDVARATAVLRGVFSAAERGDLAALDTLYAGDSLTVVEGAGINRGWADYRDHHLGPELKTMKNFYYRPVDVVVRVSGQYAWATFRYDLKGEMNGRQIDNVGRGTAILERRSAAGGTRWVVRHTQTSSRARRAGDPPSL